MSYKTITQCTRDHAFNDRVHACVAQEQKSRGELVDPLTLGTSMLWTVASASDVEAAYASALAGGNQNPGGDESVITDGMILANVQAEWPTTP
jgi:hypothetical protein